MQAPHLAKLAAFFALGVARLCMGQSGDESFYDFKGDRLGASLEEFKTRHREPGAWAMQNVCAENKKCKIEKVWQSYLRCKEETAATTACYFSSSKMLEVVQVGGHGFFLDSQLMGIALGFQYRDDWFAAVAQALTAKFGNPVSKSQNNGGTVLRWENKTSIAQLQEHDCSSGAFLSSATLGWYDEISVLLASSNCPPRSVLSYQQSNLIFVHKGLASTARQRIEQAVKAKAAKARSDI